jgi:hypothetical protein
VAISFPISPPSEPTHSSIKWVETTISGLTQNPYTLQQQVFEYDGSGWAIEVGFEVMTREEFAPWSAFLSKLRGQVGTFYYGDRLQKNILGAGGGTPQVDGGSQTEYTLLTKLWPNSTLVLKAGDIFSINNRLYKSLTDVTSNGSGAATIEVWPRLKAHANNTALVLAEPKGIFRMQSTRVETLADRTQLYKISFAAIEAM